MRIRLSQWLKITFLLWSSGAAAQTLTLTQVVDAVRATHPGIEAARQDVKSAKNRIPAESWLPDPMAGVMLEEIPFGSGPKQADMKVYEVSQTIPFPTKLVTKAKALGHEYDASKAMFDAAERRAVLDAKRTFFELVANKNALSDKHSVIASYERAIASLSKAYESEALSTGTTGTSTGGGMAGAGGVRDMAGMTEMADGSSPLDDVLMLKMKKAEAETELHDLHHAEKAFSARLNLLMGRDVATPIRKITMPPVKPLKMSEAALEKKLLEHNADLSALSAMVKKSQKDVSLAKQNLLPDLTPGFEYNQRMDNTNAYSLGLSLNVPLWGWRNAAEIRMAKAETRKVRADLENAKLGLRAELHNLVNHAKWHYQIIGKYRSEILPLARSLVSRATAVQSLNQSHLWSTSQKLVNYHQASAMYWEMWKDYQIEFAMLEELVGEEL